MGRLYESNPNSLPLRRSTAKTTAHLIGEVNEDVWPEFMLQDPVADEYWDGLFAEFVEYQYALLDQDGVIAAFANSAPLHWTEPLEHLPDNGWDWAMVRSSADHQAGRIRHGAVRPAESQLRLRTRARA